MASNTRSRIGTLIGCLTVLGMAGTPAFAQTRPSASRYAPDYSDVRGFNYPSGLRGLQYDHERVDREMGYAQKLDLNLARAFLSYRAWETDRATYTAHVKAFVRTAHARGIGTMLIFIDLPGGMMPNLFEESAKPTLREYAQDMVEAVGKEPGLAFWDATNEPDLVRLPSVQPNTNQAQRIAVARFMAATLNELDPVTPVTIGCLYLTCTEQTADVVDVLSYHDYSQTRAQIVADITRAQRLSAAKGKPIITTEMGCTGRANPYDIEIEEHNRARMGWVIWELMITTGGWGPIHGVFYPDGTTRDPAIAAAILGIFRNRGENVVPEEPDREGILGGVVEDAGAWLTDTNPDWFTGLVIAESAANLLEANQLVGLRELPSRKVDALRRSRDVAGLRKLIEEFRDALLPYKSITRAPAHRYYTPAVLH